MANEQRQIIYSQRNTILEADVITDLLDSMRENVIENEILNFKDENAPLNNWNLDGIENSLANIFGHNFLIRDWLKEDKNLDENGLITRIFNETTSLYKEKGNDIGPAMRDFEKQILLQIIDNSWKDHLSAVDSLRQGIGLRSYGNKNPKLEFRRESFELFETLLQKIRHEGVRFLSRVEIETNSPEDVTRSRDERKETLHHETASAFDNAQQNPVVTNNQDTASSQTSGNRRLRRAEAKMARKNAKKKK
jgi:preprotein translocase subunit SecA